jgi:hypothetical protein
METAFQDITLVGNIFTNGKGGVSLKVEQPREVQRLTVTNNTFFLMKSWLALENCSLDQVDITIAHNLILQSDQIKLTGQNLEPVAKLWFRNNWWERSEGMDKGQAQLAADLKEEKDVKLLSREPADKDFLRPAPDAMPKGAANYGAGHPYIGALPPATTSPPPEPQKGP